MNVFRLFKEVERELERIEQMPFQVSILGQTGVGKSSLINALFGTNLRTDPIRPCTKEIERIVVKGQNDHELWFYDLPGIGESEKTDDYYLSQYRERFEQSDVILWAFHADNRSVTFDLDALRKILSPFSDEEKGKLVSKVTFVMTKVDTIYFPPWIFCKQGSHGFFAPSDSVKEVLQQKSLYYQDIFLRPFGDFLISKTHNKEQVDHIENTNISCNEFTIEYIGFMDRNTLLNLQQNHKKHKDIFERLYDNYQVIYCSSKFKLNLCQLILVIINKLGPQAFIRFKNFAQSNDLDSVLIIDRCINRFTSHRPKCAPEKND